MPAPTKKRAVITLDDSHDLTLKVGPETTFLGPTFFRVNSAVLKMISKPWKAMLAGPLSESSAAEIPFPEDCPKVFHIVLLIAHFKLDKLPETLTKDELKDLATFCDKYDVVHIVRPYTFSKPWVGPYKQQGVLWKADADVQDWVFILSVFQHEEDFEYMVSRIAMTAEIVDADYGPMYLMKGGQKIDLREFLPDKILSKIRYKRTEVIKSMFFNVSRALDEAFGFKACRNRSQYSQATKIGMLIMVYKNVGLYPLPASASAMHKSVAYYYEGMKNIPKEYITYKHSDVCNLGMCMGDLVAGDTIGKAIETHTGSSFRELWDKAGCV